MIRATITGADQVLKMLEGLSPKLQKELKKSVGMLCLKLARNVKQNKLSGQVLKVKTGTLRRSITSKVVDTPAGPSGTVGTNLAYGAVHEFGFSGTQSVKGHMRMIKQAFGKSINPTQVSVRSHSRKVNLPERSFIRSAAEEMEGEIQAELVNAVTRSIKP